MHRNILEKHGWSIALAVLLSQVAGEEAQAAPGDDPVKVAVAAPLPNSLVAGRITVSVAYDAGFSKITAFTVLVDDMIHSSKNYIGLKPRGIQYIDLDTRTIPDGNHTLKVVAMGMRGALGMDGLDVTIRNGAPGGPDLVPPLVQFRGLRDGDNVSGKIKIDILAEDNTTQNLLVSLFVNRQVRLLKSTPPYFLELDTASFLDPKTGTGTISLEAWAFDKAENLGKSRSLTLNVWPGPDGPQTKKQEDPTLPRRSDPTLPPPLTARAPDMIRSNMGGGLVIPLGPSRMTDPSAKAPAPAKGNLNGEFTPETSDRVPGARPDSRAIRPAGSPVAGEFAPVGGDASGKLAGSKSTLPYQYRPDSNPSKTLAKTTAPQTIAGKVNGSGLAGTRSSAPGARPGKSTTAASRTALPKVPQTLGTRSAAGTAAITGRVSTPPARPKLGPVMAKADIRVTPPSTARVSPDLAPATTPGKITVDLPLTLPMRTSQSVEMPGGPVPVPQVNPTLSPSFRSRQPVVRIAKKPSQLDLPGEVKLEAKEPVIVVVDPNAKPDRNGKRPAQVFRLRDRLPRDREHRVSKGETLDALARKYRVTSRSILVANGITSPRRLQTGATIKIPGSFNVVLNHQRVAFDVAPRVENGLPLAPFRQIFEHAGGVVVWYGETQEVRAATETKDVKVKIGSKEATVNQMVVVMEKEAFIESGRTIVPISFLEKALDLVAEYDVRSGSVHLVKK